LSANMEQNSPSPAKFFWRKGRQLIGTTLHSTSHVNCGDLSTQVI
jgi:hypothetical protein